MQPIFPADSIVCFNNPEPKRPKCAAHHSSGLVLAFVLAMMAFIARPAMGQVMSSPSQTATNAAPALIVSDTTTIASNQLQDARLLGQKTEEIRTACISGRRRICGKVLQIVPEGLVVESGYTNLLRPELSHSWLAPGNVTSSLPPNLVEQNSPGAICIGLVLVTDIPKRPAVKAYDYVILQAYPAGQYNYVPVPTVKKTIRRFSVGLATAVQLNLAAGEK
jgi:hypothetical protein